MYHTDHRTRIVARETDRRTETGRERERESVPYRPPHEDSGERDIQTDREREREREWPTARTIPTPAPG